MGGYGSGYQGRKKGTVEEARRLDVRDLGRLGVLSLGTFSSGTLTWRRGDGEARGSVHYTLDTFAEYRPHAGELHLFYTRQTTPPDDVGVTVPLDTVPQPFGGVRWWFQCPRCSRRVRALYLPPGGRVFSCRTCHGLTYESVQKHDARIDWFRRNPEAMLRAFKGRDPSLLALRAALKGL